MSFKFRLESIYKLRIQEEREIQMELGRLRQEEYRVHQRIEDGKKEQGAWGRVYSEESLKNEPAANLMLIENYLIALDAQERAMKQQLKVLEKEIEGVLVRVEQAYKARRQVEYLRDLRREEYVVETKRQEIKDAAEMTLLRFGRSDFALNREEWI